MGDYFCDQVIELTVTFIFSMYVIILLTTTQDIIRSGANARTLPDVYWNSTNSIFRIDNTDHIFVVKIGDQIDFICPYLDSRLVTPVWEVEVLKIHSVSQWSYDYCALTNDSIVVGVCNKPLNQTRMTVVFREYTPKPGGLEFLPGNSYYFITTSTGRIGGLENKRSGLCLLKNMKVKFEVKDDFPAVDAVDIGGHSHSNDYFHERNSLVDNRITYGGSKSFLVGTNSLSSGLGIFGGSYQRPGQAETERISHSSYMNLKRIRPATSDAGSRVESFSRLIIDSFYSVILIDLLYACLQARCFCRRLMICGFI